MNSLSVCKQSFMQVNASLSPFLFKWRVSRYGVVQETYQGSNHRAARSLRVLEFDGICMNLLRHCKRGIY